MKNYTAPNRVILYLMIAVFFVSAFVNWLEAEIPYWPLILHEKGFTWAEIPYITFYKGALLGILEIGVYVLLLLLNYQVAKRYKIDRAFIIRFLALSSISVLLGLLFGYVIKQIEMFQYSILTVGILSLIPSELGSKIVWCVLGIIIGDYKTKIEKRTSA